MAHGAGKAEIEQLFGRLDLIAVALFCVGLLILFAGLAERRSMTGKLQGATDEEMTLGQAGVIGATQGLSLPFRGFSRSGSTISAGMLAGVNREHAETFSFALAVVLTPAVLGREALRLLKFSHEAAAAGYAAGPAWGVGSECAGAGAGVLCGAGGAEVALKLAGEREVVAVWGVLSGGERGGLWAAFEGVLRATPETSTG